MPKKCIYLVFSIFASLSVFSQNQLVKDTSFTVYSAYIKAKKNFPDIQIAQLIQTEKLKEYNDLVYKKIGERTLTLDVIRKDSKKICPAVLLIHGGGWESGDKSQLKPLAQQLARKGYVCFLPEYRLSDEAIFPAGIKDLKTALTFIKTHSGEFGVDLQKIAVLGFSSGGQMAALIGTTQGNPAFEDTNDIYPIDTCVQAIIDIDGILAFKHPESEENLSASLWLGGRYEEQPKNWEQASALTHVDGQTPPILFLNSSIHRFHAGRDDMIKVLDQNTIYHKTYTFENTPHTFILFHPWFEKGVKHIVKFLHKTLK